jgi:hypothetical protein
MLQVHLTIHLAQHAAHETTANPRGIRLDQHAVPGIKNAVTFMASLSATTTNVKVNAAATTMTTVVEQTIVIANTTLVTFARTMRTTTQHEVTNVTEMATTILPKASNQNTTTTDDDCSVGAKLGVKRSKVLLTAKNCNYLGRPWYRSHPPQV